ncbi:MAG: AraC family transcriptional regulator [Pseudomonadota bacterium]
MSIVNPQLEIVDRSSRSIRYLQHGWPSDLCRWHAHEEYELHLITETTGQVFVGDYIGTFRPGSLFLVGPGVPHNWVSEPQDTKAHHRDMLIQFHRDDLRRAEKGLPELTHLQPFLDMGQAGIEFINFPFTKSRTCLAKIRDSQGIERLVHFLQLLRDLDAWGSKKTLSVTRQTTLSEASQGRINDVVNYVMQNYKSRLSLQAAADIAGMSQSAFSRYFSQKTGCRFSEFVTRVRLGYACDLLYRTDDNIATICYACGYNNLANFNRQFIRLKGVSPRAYRRAAMQGLAHAG